MLPKLITVFVVAVALQRSGSVPIGLPSGPGTMPAQSQAQPPTAFEQFASKLKLDQKKQLPQVQQILMSTAVDTEGIVREMTSLRLQMLRQARASEGLGPLIDSYATEAAKMTGLEVRAFNEIRPLLRPDQLSKSGEAFALMAGLFHPPTSSGMRSRGRGGPALDVNVALPQARGGTGGGGQRGTGGGARGMAMSANRDDVLIAILFLNNDQKKSFKASMDAAYKAAAPLRDELTKSRVVIASLIDQDAPAESISQAVDGYAAPVAQMTAAEAKALAQVLALLTPEQQPNTGTIQSAVSLMRGAFAGKKWNARVDSTFY